MGTRAGRVTAPAPPPLAAALLLAETLAGASQNGNVTSKSYVKRFQLQKGWSCCSHPIKKVCERKSQRPNTISREKSQYVCGKWVAVLPGSRAAGNHKAMVPGTVTAKEPMAFSESLGVLNITVPVR